MIGRKKIAEAARALADDCEAGKAPEMGTCFQDGCAMQRVAEHLGSRGLDVGVEIINRYREASGALFRVYSANDGAERRDRAAAVVIPLRNLAFALESAL